MSAFDGDNVTSFNQNAAANPNLLDTEVLDESHLSRQTIIDLYTRFILEFEDSNRQRYYRDQLQINYQQQEYFLEIDLGHLHAWSGEKSSLFDMRTNLVSMPLSIIPIFEIAVQNAMKMLLTDDQILSIPNFQITVRNYDATMPISQLQGNHINKVVVVQGIVVSAFKPQLKATQVKLRCRNCGYLTTARTETMSSYSTIPIPSRCPTSAMGNNNNLQADTPPCPTSPFEIVGDECIYVDVQELKLQEAPEMVPSGEMPRQVKLSCNRWLVDKVKPGTRVTCIGIYTTTGGKRRRGNGGTGGNDGSKAVEFSIPYISILGLTTDSSATQIVEGLISDDEQQELHELVSNSKDIYDRIARSIAPAIMGKEDVKKAIACSLFGGTQKRLPDGMTLRGDINVLLLGDPSVAKSQFLKFSSQVAPIAVYTSGKGSSAAGLTASVVRSQATGDFNLEAGALVLADGGLVCIDEFDKMRDQDRVAIHEAMEQQTISIAKAGITTVLNSRCSVLAAANPVFGRYDDMKSATENIDFQATILSRFDLIFILRDIQEDAMDEQLASHLINVHKFGDQSNKHNSLAEIEFQMGDGNNNNNNNNNNNGNNNNNNNGNNNNNIGNNNNNNNRRNNNNNNNNNNNSIDDDEHANADLDEIIPPDTLKKLIAYSRRLKPRLSQEAKAKIVNEYVKFRSQMAESQRQGDTQVIPITVRQLEAMIRISEAIARMSLAEEATVHHVEEAIRLFHVATLQASASASSQGGINAISPIDAAQIQSAEQLILNRIPPNQSLATRTLLTEMTGSYSDNVIKMALRNLTNRNAIMYKKQRKFLVRGGGAGGDDGQ